MAKPTFHGFFGGKSKFEKFICPCIPNNYKIYLEPFSGSFAIYFLTDIPNNTKVIFNDLNKDQTNLFACSKEYNKFYNYIKNELDDINGILYCKETKEDLIKQHYKELYYSLKKSNFRNEEFNIPDFRRASYYAFLLTSAFSSCSYTAAGFSGFKLPTFIKKLQNKDIQQKLSEITYIESVGFEEIIKKYDSSETFIYLDPPYYEPSDKRSGWYGTKNEFGQKDHIKLLELLKTLKSKWALSYYYFKELEECLPKNEFYWLEREFFRSSSSFSENKSIKGNELLILNYKPDTIKEKEVIKKLDDFWNE